MPTKMGMKRESSARTYLKRVSPKRAPKLRTYNAVRDRLIELCKGKSELSGNQASNSIENSLSSHHILGRGGQRLVNPFNIIILLEKEHWVAQENMSWEAKQALLAFIKPIRIAQGFKESDYEPLYKAFNFGKIRQ